MENTLTKAELIHGIKDKTKKAKPFVRATLLKGLKYKTRAELERIYKSARVSSDGLDIRVG
ncbi:MAG: hypothetical protein C4542_03150 [Dehalococcoidia bacterium]|nr:MAG: hypothetical protein C4542_03150 [Dehalococcoidia bacterium]